MTIDVTLKFIQGIENMTKLSKSRRQDLIFSLLKGKDEDSALTIFEIYEFLSKEDIAIDKRTIRRDMDELSETHGLISTDSHPERFYPSKDFEIKYKLELNNLTLQTLIIALNNLKHTSHDYFNDYATQAETTILAALDQKTSDELRASKDKYIFDFSLAGKPNHSEIKEFEKIMTALRENRIIYCNNDAPTKDASYNQRKRQFAPYKFILTAGIPYILVQDLEDKEFKKLRITRLKNVSLSKNSFLPENIENILNLENLVGGWGGLKDDSLDITITCNKLMATFFKEKIVHQTQNLSEISPDKFEIHFKCSHSHEFIRLISSFGGNVIHVEPKEIFDEIKEVWSSGLKNAS